MNLGKFLKYSLSITFISLVYIHLQMQIVDLAYQGQRKEAKIKDLMDKNGNTFYAISKLKSAHNLGDRLLDVEYNMQFAGADNVIYDRTADGQYTQMDNQLARKNPSILDNLLSFATQAEARSRE